MDRLENFVFSGLNLGHFWRIDPETLTSKCIKVVYRDGICEIPDFLMQNVIDDDLWYKYDTSFMHLKSEVPEVTRKLVRGALQCFSYSLRDGTIRTVNMANGGQYYGCPGAIFDDTFSALLLFTTTVSIDREHHVFRIIGHNCRISPKVFQRGDFTIEKAILKKILPYCVTHTMERTDFPYLGSNDIIPCGLEGKNTRVLIEDIDPIFIQEVVVPRVTTTARDYQQVLQRNIRDVISQT